MVRENKSNISKSLSEKRLSDNPFVVFSEWLQQAESGGVEMPEAMVLSTIDANGNPSSRMVLLRGMNERGFIFYTNYHSRKSREIERNHKVSLLFYWETLGRQVRIEGMAEKVSDEVSDGYFRTRPRENQIAAWASDQSEPVPDRETLEDRFRMMKKKFSGKPVPRPPHWGGYLVIPRRFEFWQQGEHRLHDRIVYELQSDGKWERYRLYP